MNRRLASFKYAFSGIIHTLLNEPNFRIQVIFTGIALGLGFYFNISHVDWGLLIISTGLLLSAELINTFVEVMVNAFVKGEFNEFAKVIKDVSAGFVLITGVTAFSVFMLIFGTYFLALL